MENCWIVSSVLKSAISRFPQIGNDSSNPQKREKWRTSYSNPSISPCKENIENAESFFTPGFRRISGFSCLRNTPGWKRKMRCWIETEVVEMRGWDPDCHEGMAGSESDASFMNHSSIQVLLYHPDNMKTRMMPRWMVWIFTIERTASDWCDLSWYSFIVKKIKPVCLTIGIHSTENITQIFNLFEISTEILPLLQIGECARWNFLGFKTINV